MTDKVVNKLLLKLKEDNVQLKHIVSWGVTENGLLAVVKVSSGKKYQVSSKKVLDKHEFFNKFDEEVKGYENCTVDDYKNYKKKTKLIEKKMPVFDPDKEYHVHSEFVKVVEELGDECLVVNRFNEHFKVPTTEIKEKWGG